MSVGANLLFLRSTGYRRNRSSRIDWLQGVTVFSEERCSARPILRASYLRLTYLPRARSSLKPQGGSALTCRRQFEAGLRKWRRQHFRTHCVPCNPGALVSHPTPAGVARVADGNGARCGTNAWRRGCRGQPSWYSRPTREPERARPGHSPDGRRVPLHRGTRTVDTG